MKKIVDCHSSQFDHLYLLLFLSCLIYDIDIIDFIGFKFDIVDINLLILLIVRFVNWI